MCQQGAHTNLCRLTGMRPVGYCLLLAAFGPVAAYHAAALVCCWCADTCWRVAEFDFQRLTLIFAAESRC